MGANFGRSRGACLSKEGVEHGCWSELSFLRTLTKDMSKRILGVGVILVLLAVGAYASRGIWRSWIEELQQPAIPVATPYRPATSSVPTLPVATSSAGMPVVPSRTPSSTVPAPTPVSPTLRDPFTFQGTRPAELNLAVPFMLQAPKQNWDMPYQEACEEASLLMVRGFLQGRTTDFGADEADRQIIDLVAYEESKGDAPDVTLRRLGEIAEAKFGFRPVVKTVTSIDDVKNAIANGYPVIVPASGKALQNPNFRNGGPPYHMVVAKGYLADGRIVTNDPGTRKGKDYVYGASLFFNAIHDWNDGDVPNGEKIILVLLPKE